MKNEKLWRAILLTLCFLVFLFVMRAKTEIYNGGAPVKATVSTASKLWLGGQKMEVRLTDSVASVLFWMAIVGFFGMSLHRERFAKIAFLPLPPRNLVVRDLHRFLRPPPVLA
jgi:hypothetical protein